MSRTIRRKSGYRWFAEKKSSWVSTGNLAGHYETRKWDKKLECFLPYTRVFWEEIPARAEYDLQQIAKSMRDMDGHYWRMPYCPAIKAYDNSVRRNCQRLQINRIIKGQEYYDDSFEESKCKGAAWYFD